MSAKTVMCAKLQQELPAIDPATPAGGQASRMALMIGGKELQARVLAGVSQKAWDMWKDHMIMIFNEYRLDPTSDEANKILRQHIEQFFFGQAAEIPNWKPEGGSTGSSAAGHQF